MKYTARYWKMLIHYIKKSLNRRYGKEYTKRLIKKADAEYREMLGRVDDVGAYNPMASNVYECLVFLAVWKAAEEKISVDELREITVDVMSAQIFKLAGLFINGNKKSGITRLRNMMLKNAAWLEEHPEYRETSWDFNFNDNKNKGGFYYHFTRCPLYDFARKEGYMELLPVMCDIDFLSAKLMHLTLHREQTLAGGGDKCDYWFVGDKKGSD